MSTSLSGRLGYSRNLINAGIAGVRAGHHSASCERLSPEKLAQSARKSLVIAAAGACVGLLYSRLVRPHGNRSRAIALTAVGGTLSFCTGFLLDNRQAASTLVHGAAREVRRVSDAHWLEMHPINYA
jgi:hypothetical protein